MPHHHDEPPHLGNLTLPEYRYAKAWIQLQRASDRAAEHGAGGTDEFVDANARVAELETTIPPWREHAITGRFNPDTWRHWHKNRHSNHDDPEADTHTSAPARSDLAVTNAQLAIHNLQNRQNPRPPGQHTPEHTANDGMGPRPL